jgi:serine-type D-Ala-D-Ala carboxypeptidase/endopeptidase
MSITTHHPKLRNFIFTLLFGAISMINPAYSASDKRPIKPGLTEQSSFSQVLKKCTLVPKENEEPNRKPEEIRGLLQSMVDGKRATGIAVGLVTPEGRCIITAGSSGKRARPHIDDQTMFELGSITKTLTGALLADMVAKGELKLDEPIGPYLPTAARDNTELAAVTFRQLTTHSSGLSRLPITIAFTKSMLSNPNDPYANYSQDEFTADLATMKPGKDKNYAYSNTGVALLGMLLGNRAGKSYSELVQTRLLDPLGMSATSLVHAKDDDIFAAQPHDASLKPTVGWNLGVFLPTGGARSNVGDMMKLIDANLARKTPWAYSHEQLAPLGKVGGIAYNWHIARLLANTDGKEKRDTLVWHNGGTYGSNSFVGFDIERGIGVVVLINTGALGVADDIAMHLWDQRNPRPSITNEKKTISRIVIFLIAAIAFTNLLLAMRAQATLRVLANAPQNIQEHSHNEQTARKFAGWRRMFFIPFVDRIDVATRVFSAIAGTLFVLKFVPVIPLVSVFGVHQLLLAVLGLSIAYALWAARNVAWKIPRTLWQWIGLSFGVLLSALFLWIAL